MSKGERKTHYGKGGSDGLRKRFSLRLRPRLRLLAMRMKRASIRSILNEVGIFIRKNIRAVTFSASISTVFCLCFLFLKLTTLPPPKSVPYSNLIISLQNGYVEKVLVEEGSRRIYYNMKSQHIENDMDFYCATYVKALDKRLTCIRFSFSAPILQQYSPYVSMKFQMRRLLLWNTYCLLFLFSVLVM